jgi:hypothetical protein
MIDPPGHSRRLSDLPVFTSRPWQMSYGERTFIEGMLSMLKPRLAIEIGRAEGGSLRRIAAHSDEVFSFDLVEAPAELLGLENVTALSGDSHAQLPIELKRIADEGRNVDFVLVDGDHSADGVRRDVQDLLDSDSIVNTIILIHDTLNEEVRQGLTQVDYDACEKIAWIDLDFVPGYVASLSERLGECWGGLGLIVVDANGGFRSDGQRHREDLFDQPSLVWPVAQWVRREGRSPATLADCELVPDQQLQQAHEQLSSVTADLELHRAWLNGIQGSISWRITSPLRALKRRLRER